MGEVLILHSRQNILTETTDADVNANVKRNIFDFYKSIETCAHENEIIRLKVGDDSKVYSINHQSYDAVADNKINNIQKYTKATNITLPATPPVTPATPPVTPATPATDESNLIAKYDAAILILAMNKASIIAEAFTKMLLNQKNKADKIQNADIEITKTINLNESTQQIETKYLTLKDNRFEEYKEP